MGARFVARRPGAPAVFASYRELRDGAYGFAAALGKQIGLGSGARIGLVGRASPQFYHAFFGIMAAGAVPAVLPPPPLFSGTAEHNARSARMFEAGGLKAVHVVGAPDSKTVRRWPFPLLDPVVPPARPPDGPAPHAPGPDDEALVQFSSGTTATPKPIVMTHAKVLFNARAILRHVGTAADMQDGVTWLPLHHDMGLIGCMIAAMVHPLTMTYLTPEDFLLRPERWLQTIAELRACGTLAPCFALASCNEIAAERLPAGLDLSCLRCLITGADRQDARTLEAFASKFAPFGLRREALMPSYGLAEAGLAVTMTPPGAGPTILRLSRQALTSSGRSLAGFQVEIADADGAPLPDSVLGRVVVRGGSMAGGADTTPEGWYDTGDDGFLRDGELFITGRRKDVVIVNGVNYAAEYLEAVATAGIAERLVCAAVSTPAGDCSAPESVRIFAERSRRPAAASDTEIARAIRQNLGTALGLVPAAVTVVHAGWLPRTTSGKIRRQAAGQL